ncbi:MAG: hypothetical protein F6K65_43875, partial [Moorea sp. SIO3C2]|nr:hypothetical protein [Moorena sp. SIO3C2]
MPELCNLPLVGIECRESLVMLRSVLADFEGSISGAEDPIGSVGVTAFSEIVGQCSVYPLAIQDADQDAVSPLIFHDGRPIQPQTDLCDRKE